MSINDQNHKHISIAISAFFVVTLFLLSINEAIADTTSNLFAQWKMDETTGISVSDSSSTGGATNLSMINMLLTDRVQGKVSKALSFNGETSLLSDTSHGYPTNSTSATQFEYNGGNITISLWFNPSVDETDGGYLFTKRWNENKINYSLLYTSAQRLTFNISLLGKEDIAFGMPATSESLTPGEWNNVVVRIQSDSSAAIFLNGQEVASGNWSNTVSSNYNTDANIPIVIGSGYPYQTGQSGGTTNHVKGIIDEIKMYDRALSDTDILQLFTDVEPFSIQNIEPISVDENDSILVTTDLDNPRSIPVSLSASNLPSGSAYNPSTKKFTWTPSYSQAGNYEITFSATDGTHTDIEKLNISVQNVAIAYSCQNSTNSKCLDFGSTNESASGATYTTSAIGSKLSDGSINYRAVNSANTVQIDFPAFDTTDALGLPNSPLLLEIRYKDTLTSGINVYSHIEYFNEDPLWNPDYTTNTNKDWELIAPILYRYGTGDWKHEQYLFQKSNFQLIRAIDGKYSIKIVMPTTSDGISLPIDYISLRSVSDSEATSWLTNQRSVGGYTEAALPNDQPSAAVNYSDKNLTVFTRDIMRPIYQSTKPALEEIDLPLEATSPLNNKESLALGLFSENGISDLTITASDLVLDSNNKISSSEIKLRKVVYGYSSTTPIADFSTIKYYALLQDRLEDFGLYSLAANTSGTIWIDVDVPETINGGIYQGAIQIKQGSALIKEIPLQIQVLPLQLDETEYVTALYADPYSDVYTNDQTKVYDLYHDIQAGVMITVRNQGPLISKENGEIVINSSNFENKLDKYIQEKIVNQTIVLNFGELWYSIYGVVYNGSLPTGDANIYSKLDAPEFKDAFAKVINKFQNIAAEQNINFIYYIIDEPGSHPFERIVADRLYRQTKDLGGKTYVTCNVYCTTEISSDTYITPTGKISPLNAITDYPAYNLFVQNLGANESNPSFYMTSFAQYRSPVYNRFLMGYFAERTGTKFIAPYAIKDSLADIYNDFDSTPRFYNGGSDLILAYPSWDGTLYPTMAAIGIRLGIEDARYIATLKRLIRENPGATADSAQAYLSGVMSNLSPNFFNDYSTNGLWDELGYYQRITSRLSADSADSADSTNFEVFNVIRSNIQNYIEELNPNKSIESNPPFVSNVAGTINGDILITYSDNTIDILNIFNSITAKKTIVKKYKNQKYMALSASGKKIAFVDVINKTVSNLKTLSKKQKFSKNILRVKKIRKKKIIFTISKNKKKVFLIVLKINANNRIIKKDKKRITNKNIKLNKTKIKHNIIFLKNSKANILNKYLVSKKFKLVKKINR